MLKLNLELLWSQKRLMSSPSLWEWNQIQVNALSLWMIRSSLLPMRGKGSLIVCRWGYCPWGQETTCRRGPIWRALSLLPMGGEKNLEGMGEVVVYGAKSLHTTEDNFMPVVNGWIPWPVYVLVWYIYDNLPYVKHYDFGNYIVGAHKW